MTPTITIAIISAATAMVAAFFNLAVKIGDLGRIIGRLDATVTAIEQRLNDYQNVTRQRLDAHSQKLDKHSEQLAHLTNQ
jgi:predicted RNA-binding protein YlqC (UPF0109 family)